MRARTVAVWLGVSMLALGAYGEDAPKQATLKSAACPPECGFLVRSHDEQEVIGMLKQHAKAHHGMTISDADAKGMVKDAGKAKRAKKDK